MSVYGMTREQWIEVFRATGLDDAMMHRWHVEFERRYPAQHQAFLQWIGLSEEDLRSVRAASRVG